MNVLFVCGANMLRSPIAERFLQKYDGFKADSAGIMDGTRTLPEDIPCCSDCAREQDKELLDGHESKLLTPELMDWSDIILYMDELNRIELIEHYGENDKYAPLDIQSDIPSKNFNPDDPNDDYDVWWVDLKKQISDAVDAFALSNKQGE